MSDRIEARRAICVADIFHAEAPNGDLIPCRIDSVARLPPDIHETMMALDRKFSQKSNGDPTQFWLTDREKRDLLFVADFYPANPI